MLETILNKDLMNETEYLLTFLKTLNKSEQSFVLGYMHGCKSKLIETETNKSA